MNDNSPRHRISLLQRNVWKREAAADGSLGPHALLVHRFFHASEGLSQATSVRLVLQCTAPLALVSVNGNGLVHRSRSADGTGMKQPIARQPIQSQATISSEAFEIGRYLQKRNLLVLGWYVHESSKMTSPLPRTAPTEYSPTDYLLEVYLEITP